MLSLMLRSKSYPPLNKPGLQDTISLMLILPCQTCLTPHPVMNQMRLKGLMSIDVAVQHPLHLTRYEAIKKQT
jgi:hypothetical protein